MILAICKIFAVQIFHLLSSQTYVCCLCLNVQSVPRAATWKRFEDGNVYKVHRHKGYTKLIKSSIGHYPQTPTYLGVFSHLNMWSDSSPRRYINFIMPCKRPDWLMDYNFLNTGIVLTLPLHGHSILLGRTRFHTPWAFLKSLPSLNKKLSDLCPAEELARGRGSLVVTENPGLSENHNSSCRLLSSRTMPAAILSTFNVRSHLDLTATHIKSWNCCGGGGGRGGGGS